MSVEPRVSERLFNASRSHSGIPTQAHVFQTVIFLINAWVSITRLIHTSGIPRITSGVDIRGCWSRSRSWASFVTIFPTVTRWTVAAIRIDVILRTHAIVLTRIYHAFVYIKLTELPCVTGCTNTLVLTVGNWLTHASVVAGVITFAYEPFPAPRSR
jgi:hypothetical protein